MFKNEGLEIFVAANGFVVRNGSRGYDSAANQSLVFETRAGLLAYLRRHFDESVKAAPDKRAAKP